MFKRIVVVVDAHPASNRALATAISLARLSGTQLQVVTIMQEVTAFLPESPESETGTLNTFRAEKKKLYEQLQREAQQEAASFGVKAVMFLLEAKEGRVIKSFLKAQEADLVVVGLNNRGIYVARLWSAVYTLAQEAPCSVLGVH